MQAGPLNVVIRVKDEDNSDQYGEPFISVDHEADRLCGQIEHEETDFNWIKKEIKLEDTTKLQNQLISTSGITSKSIMECKGCIKCVEQMIKFFHDYSSISTKCKGFGPIRLVECPACTVQYKNSPDRLIRLFNHVQNYHKKKKMRLLQEIFYSYYPLIHFMKKVLPVPAIQEQSFKNNSDSKCLIV